MIHPATDGSSYRDWQANMRRLGNLAKEEEKGLYELQGPKDTKSKQSTESPSQGS